MITIFIKLGVLLSDFKSVPQFVKIKDPVEVDDDILAFLISHPASEKDLYPGGNSKLHFLERVTI